MSGRGMSACGLALAIAFVVSLTACVGDRPASARSQAATATTATTAAADATTGAPAESARPTLSPSPAASVPTSMPSRENVHCGGVAPIATYATARASGGVQRARVKAVSNFFRANNISAKATLPLELEFSGVTPCIEAVRFPALGKTVDLTTGRARIRLPALRPGVYDFQCARGIAFGKLFVSR